MRAPKHAEKQTTSQYNTKAWLSHFRKVCAGENNTQVMWGSIEQRPSAASAHPLIMGKANTHEQMKKNTAARWTTC